MLVAGEYAPYVMSWTDRPGLLVEVVAAAFARSGVKTTVLFLPWRRCAMMLRQGDAFAAFPFTYTAKRGEYAWFSDTIWISRCVFFYLRGRLGEYDFTSFDDLRGFTIAGTSGHHYEEVFEEKGLSMDYASSEGSGIRKVWEERCALFAEDELAGWELIRRVYPERFDQFGSTPTPWYLAPLSLMVSKT
ncbi:transporter substrate-binding domain-containing protein [Pseudodesulfovibrio thermohalotolerans]|uniref:substrate-binding periplasmic protein n=1 Tax=Pseudodesulfovibrio thermohalotolerans TaxID=2880651 RepID=UPI0022B9E416|nr:transporter substrate-binding domain-containing protein [Pseudodesulfovibrio thermohalotolerans]WFS62180.1 transporter substrate-binding domain-containing protein [Pseudodesulfovibrio thermohalotolerans]